MHVRDADAALSLCEACGVVDEASVDLGRQVGGDAYGLGSNDVRPECWRRLGGGRSGLALLGRRRRGSLSSASSSCSQLFRFRHRPAQRLDLVRGSMQVRLSSFIKSDNLGSISTN